MKKQNILFIGRREIFEPILTPAIQPYLGTVTFLPNGTPDKDKIREAGDANIIFVDAMEPISAELMAGMPDLRLVQSGGVGFQAIDGEAAASRHIYVCNCRGINAGAVAEQAVLLMLGLLRHVRYCDRRVREGAMIETKSHFMDTGSIRELSECTVGIIGLGASGEALARILQGFGAKTLYTSAHRHPEIENNLAICYRPLDRLLAESDIVSLHLPVNKTTKNMVDADFFAKMKDGAYFINTARGELVNTRALLDALACGKLAGAGLDVIAGEPVNLDNPIFDAPAEVEEKILFSPHIAGVTGGTFRRACDLMRDAILAMAEGRRPENVVNGL